MLREIDAYVRGLDPRVVQVSASLGASMQEVEILRPDGTRLAEARPMVRLNVSVIVEENGRRESGSAGGGGRTGLAPLMGTDHWQDVAREALRIAAVNLEAEPAPAGVMDVVLGPGWPGILLHEAIGHGLEGDFNRKGTSAFAGLMGKRIAAPGVTVVDDGTMPDRRGSISFDDEGTPSGRTVLIEDGILVGYMQDRQNARLMGVAPTGNGRRQSYAHAPMPRMTNTYMLGGDATPADILAELKDGIYAVGFGGGQVDITNGKFVFSCTEAYRVKDGVRRRPGQGRDADRRRRHRAPPDPRDRQRHGARPRHGQLRQERPVGAGRRRPADDPDRRPDRRRQRRLSRPLFEVTLRQGGPRCPSLPPKAPAAWRRSPTATASRPMPRARC